MLSYTLFSCQYCFFGAVDISYTCMYKLTIRQLFCLLLVLALAAGVSQAWAHEASGQTEDQAVNQLADSQTQDAAVTGGAELDSGNKTQGVGSRIKSHFQEQEEKFLQLQQQVRENLREKRDQLKQQAQNRQNQLQEKRQELKRKLHDRQAERVTAFSKRMLDRFEAAVKRLDNLSARISARLDKLSSGGKHDVSVYRSALDAAKAKIDSARSRLQEARTSLDMIVPSENPKTQFEDARAKLNAVKDEIKAAHAALVDAINSIKEGLIKKNGK